MFTYYTKQVGQEGFSPLPTQQQLDVQEKVVDGDGSIDHPYQVNIHIKNTSDSEAWQGIVKVNYSFKADHPNFYLPGFMYGTNQGQEPIDVVNNYPRIRQQSVQQPASSWWMTRSDRLSHPVIIGTSDSHVYGIIASPYIVEENGQLIPFTPSHSSRHFVQYNGFACETATDSNSISYTLGYQNAPYFFKRADIVKPCPPLQSDQCITLPAGADYSFTMTVYDVASSSRLTVHHIIKACYYAFHQAPRDISSIEECVTKISQAIANDAYIPSQCQYSGMVHDDGSLNTIFSFSWTNGLAVAVPMLIAALRTHSEAIYQQAMGVINKIIHTPFNANNGLPYTSFDDHGNGTNAGWWLDQTINRGHAGYILGQGIFYLLKAYHYEQKLHDVDHPDWIHIANSVCAQLVKGLNSDNEFPYVYSEKSAAGIEYNSFGSCWCATAIAYCSYLLHTEKWLSLLEKSEDHYFHTYVEKMECYGGPLDTSKSPDNEGILAFIRLDHLMYLLTQKPQYLKHMQFALYQEFSYKYCYNSPIKYNPLKKLHWCSCGGSITSVCNPHIHPMSSSILDELIFCYQQTGDQYILDRYHDTLNWGKQSYNRQPREFDFGKTGWMSERFCYSQGLLTQYYPDHTPASTWFNLLPWAAASVIDGYTGLVWDQEVQKSK